VELYADQSPSISSATYPETRSGGGVGQPGTFTFESNFPNSTTFVYSLDGGSTWQTVDAGADGTASVTWTPDTAGDNMLMAYSQTADGTRRTGTSTCSASTAEPHVGMKRKARECPPHAPPAAGPVRTPTRRPAIERVPRLHLGLVRCDVAVTRKPHPIQHLTDFFAFTAILSMLLDYLWEESERIGPRSGGTRWQAKA
jgi:hypothetical protein